MEEYDGDDDIVTAFSDRVKRKNKQRYTELLGGATNMEQIRLRNTHAKHTK
jgi:hypothetical protein